MGWSAVWYFLVILTFDTCNIFYGNEPIQTAPIAQLVERPLSEREVVGRASTFTSVNGSVSCLCNKRLQNWPTVYTNFSM